jgi:hypothetical protein
LGIRWGFTDSAPIEVDMRTSVALESSSPRLTGLKDCLIGELFSLSSFESCANICAHSILTYIVSVLLPSLVRPDLLRAPFNPLAFAFEEGPDFFIDLIDRRVAAEAPAEDTAFAGLEREFSRARVDSARALRFPPVMLRVFLWCVEVVVEDSSTIENSVESVACARARVKYRRGCVWVIMFIIEVFE